MQRLMVFVIGVMFLSGCLAIVHEDDTVQSIGIPGEEVLDILQQGEEKPDEEKSEWWLFEKRTRE